MDLKPLALIAASTVLAAPAVAQDFAAAPGKTRVTLFFEGRTPVQRPDTVESLTLETQAPPRAPTVKVTPSSAATAVDPTVEPTAVQRVVRNLTDEEWASHPSNPANRP